MCSRRVIARSLSTIFGFVFRLVMRDVEEYVYRLRSGPVWVFVKTNKGRAGTPTADVRGGDGDGQGDDGDCGTAGAAALSARNDGVAARSLADAGHRGAPAAGGGDGSGRGSAAGLGAAPATATVRAFAAARMTTRGPVVKRG